jgi:hypothetical protein
MGANLGSKIQFIMNDDFDREDIKMRNTLFNYMLMIDAVGNGDARSKEELYYSMELFSTVNAITRPKARFCLGIFQSP